MSVMLLLLLFLRIANTTGDWYWAVKSAQGCRGHFGCLIAHAAAGCGVQPTLRSSAAQVYSCTLSEVALGRHKLRDCQRHHDMILLNVHVK